MTSDLQIVIRNYSRHIYKPRIRAWVRVYVDLLDDWRYAQLPAEAKATLFELILASRPTEGRIKADLGFVFRESTLGSGVCLAPLFENGLIALERSGVRLGEAEWQAWLDEQTAINTSAHSEPTAPTYPSAHKCAPGVSVATSPSAHGCAHEDNRPLIPEAVKETLGEGGGGCRGGDKGGEAEGDRPAPIEGGPRFARIPPARVFQTLAVGKEGGVGGAVETELMEGHVKRLKINYPNVDVEHELRRIQVYLEERPDKRPTADRLYWWIRAWMNRSAESVAKTINDQKLDISTDVLGTRPFTEEEYRRAMGEE